MKEGLINRKSED